jgi:hypothetical protein
VFVSDSALVISTFSKRVIPLQTIVTCDVKPSGRGKELVVQIQNGETIRLSSLLGDFDELVRMISARRRATQEQ